MNFLIKKNELEDKEEQLRKQVSELSDEDRKIYYKEQAQLLKDPDTYAALNVLFLGGFHHLYLNKYLWFFGELLSLVLGLFLIFSGEEFGFCILIAIAIIELPQLFFSQKIAREHNYQLSYALLEKIKNKLFN
ncbi:hypothetical protein [Aliivibrio sp. 1S128]|jgi:TM2 domain-containing membrane protein YozV|uniref:hypothetical protein n=1 Tax=Aliivibrio sp. 1S128 TaxID=1840085 RepID=UPI00080E4F5C|nr:hypothetical protein [Aliivibrio sp. 1S128]OCH25986.1 hypothetical protein A6E03_00825 [Aliivibrio sp. 1S128]